MINNIWIRAVLTTLVAAALGLLSLTTSLPAQAAVSNGKCADNTGLNVVVDFQELGGGVQVKCVENWDRGPAVNGLDAAFTLTGTERWGLSFICRVNGKPGAADEACIDTPPPDAYWGYWVASSGAWSYSTTGIAGRNAKPGEWHGLSFSKNRTPATNPAPGVAPVVPPAPKPKPKPSATKPPAESPGKPPTSSKPSADSKPKPKPHSGNSATNKPNPAPPSTSKPNSSTGHPDATETATPDDAESTKPEEAPEPGTLSDDSEEIPTATADSSSAPDATPSQTSPSEMEETATTSPTATKTSSDDTGPPVGTLIALGAIALIAVAAVIRHRVRANSGADITEDN